MNVIYDASGLGRCESWDMVGCVSLFEDLVDSSAQAVAYGGIYFE